MISSFGNHNAWLNLSRKVSIEGTVASLSFDEVSTPYGVSRDDYFLVFVKTSAILAHD